MRDIIFIIGLIFFLYYCVDKSGVVGNNNSLSNPVNEIEWLEQKVESISETNTKVVIKETISNGITYFEFVSYITDTEYESEIFDESGILILSNKDNNYANYLLKMTYERVIWPSQDKLTLSSYKSTNQI